MKYHISCSGFYLKVWDMALLLAKYLEVYENAKMLLGAGKVQSISRRKG